MVIEDEAVAKVKAREMQDNSNESRSGKTKKNFYTYYCLARSRLLLCSFMFEGEKSSDGG